MGKPGATPAYPNRAGTRCKLWRCVACKRWVPWCQGCSDDPRCDACWCSAEQEREAKEGRRQRDYAAMSGIAGLVTAYQDTERIAKLIRFT